MQSIENYLEQIAKVKKKLHEAEVIIIGAGAGLSASAGLLYSGERFTINFADFINIYHYNDMYSAGFYPYPTLEEYWGYWSRHIFMNRYQYKVGEVYIDILNLVRDKNYFVITTNVDHCFQKAGFDKKRLFYTQGDYGLWQCSAPCHKKTYNNEQLVKQMVAEQKDLKIPKALIPYCPICGKRMSMNLRCDNTFVEDDGWQIAAERYQKFILDSLDNKVLYLELGVGNNTPGIIKYPFWRLTRQNPQASLVSVNIDNGNIPNEIIKQSIVINSDIGKLIKKIL